jgi:hypothetical protein
MFRLRLHPTSSGFALGFALIALWALLWVWFIAQLAATPPIEALSVAAAPGVTSIEASTNPGG